LLNKWMGIGRLTRDPELRYTPAGNATCSFTLACDRQMKNAQGEKEADFINISIPPFKAKLAELCANYLSKGKMAYVEGSQQTRSYDGQDGQKKYVTEIIGVEVKFLSPKSEGSSQQQQPQYNQPQNTATQNTAPPSGAHQQYGQPPQYGAPPTQNHGSMPPPPGYPYNGAPPAQGPPGSVPASQLGRQVSLDDDIPF